MKQVVVGGGPVGSGVALLLANQGIDVALVTRSGSKIVHPLIKQLRGNAGDVDFLIGATQGAAVIYNCANPLYHRWPIDWPPIHKAMMATAERTGAVLAMTDNFYSFTSSSSSPIFETCPMNATGQKGFTRAVMAKELLKAHAEGRLKATLARASDFYGPTVHISHYGDRLIPNIVESKKVSVLGDLDQPHSLSYIKDVVRTLIAIGNDDRAWGKPWHVPNAPAVSQRVAVTMLAEAAKRKVRIAETRKWKVISKSLTNPYDRELLEIWWMWTQPFVVDSSLTEKTFNLSATPLEEAFADTIRWYQKENTRPQ